jgi:hypothetical protein
MLVEAAHVTAEIRQKREVAEALLAIAASLILVPEA